MQSNTPGCDVKWLAVCSFLCLLRINTGQEGPEGGAQQVVQPWRDWVGGDNIYDAFRANALATCGVQPTPMARKLVVVTRASPYRRWHDEAALHGLLRTFGRAVNMSVKQL